MARDNRSLQPSRLRHATNVVTFFDNHSWLLAQRHETCSTVPWQRSCVIARQKYRFYTERIPVLKHKLWHVIPATNDWRTAVTLVQRVYPGTESWLLYISHREGGYGAFVMNHQGSGAGGWMQFMASTYYAYSDAAFAHARSRGFDVPREANTWYSPLGQAITAGYMRYTGRDGCHWCL